MFALFGSFKVFRNMFNVFLVFPLNKLMFYHQQQQQQQEQHQQQQQQRRKMRTQLIIFPSLFPLQRTKERT